MFVDRKIGEDSQIRGEKETISFVETLRMKVRPQVDR